MAQKLADEWRGRSEYLRRYGADTQASTWDMAADELERWIRKQDDELLPLSQAAEESGYSPDHLGRLIREEKLVNYGQKWAPRLRRGSLPRKPATRSKRVARTNATEYPSDGLFRDIAESKKGRR